VSSSVFLTASYPPHVSSPTDQNTSANRTGDGILTVGFAIQKPVTMLVQGPRSSLMNGCTLCSLFARLSSTAREVCTATCRPITMTWAFRFRGWIRTPKMMPTWPCSWLRLHPTGVPVNRSPS